MAKNKQSWLKMLLAFLVVSINVTFDMLTLKYGWSWFISPLGVRPIGYFEAWGIYLYVYVLRGMPKLNDSNEELTIWDKMIQSFAQTSVILFAMYLIHLYLTLGTK